MDKKIMKTGLRCKVNAKVMLMQYFLSNEETRRIVIGKMKELGSGVSPVSEECQMRLMKEFGVRINSVTRLDDEGLEKAYDALAQEGRIDKWLNDQIPNMKERAKRVLEWDRETETDIDVTGFLVYGIVENDRCRQKLMEFMETQGEACYQAYRDSAYSDGSLVRWFPRQKMLAAMLCTGLLELVRAEEGEKTAYETFIAIASSGYKRMRKYVKHRNEIAGKEFQEIMAVATPDMERDALYFLSAGVIGLVMAEDVQIPLRTDFLLLSFFPILQEWGQSLLEAPEPVEISEEGKNLCIEALEEYHCGEKNWVVRYMSRGAVDFEGICNVLGLNIRILRDITMTESELQQIFSLCPDMKKEAVIPALVAAALCKYFVQREGKYRPEEDLRQLGNSREMEEDKECSRVRIREIKQQMEDLRREQTRLRQERDALAVRITELEQAVFKRREQIEQLKVRQEHARQEIKELKNFVCYLTENPVEESGEQANETDTGRRRKLGLERRRVVVIGGHENWQRRFREQFPMWQFLPANKNNFDAGCVRNKEVIILNTAVLKHSCYYRIMSERSEGQTVLYVHGNNLERCLDELERQIGQE